MTDPRIYLISKPSLCQSEVKRFLQDSEKEWIPTEDASDAEHVVEIAGRVCYMSFSGEKGSIRYPNGIYINNLIEKGHESVLEHASWSFIIDGVSRAFTHQLVRHRVGFSYSQLSQQYHDESSAEFIRPAGLSNEASQLWDEATRSALLSYRKILDLLSANEEMDLEKRRLLRSSARSLLPNATRSTIAVSANARAIRNFVITRGAILGDIEMRIVSSELFKLVKDDAPNLFSGIETNIYSDGWPITRLSAK